MLSAATRSFLSRGRLNNQLSRTVLVIGRKVVFRWKLQYLVRMMHMSWRPHWDAVQEKAFKLLRKLNRLTAVNWGIKLILHKMLYALMVCSINLYAAPIWFNGKVVVVNRLLSIQRGLLQCVTNCYNRLSTNALHVLLGVLPLDLLNWRGTKRL